MAKDIRPSKRHLSSRTVPLLLGAWVAMAMAACTVPPPQFAEPPSTTFTSPLNAGFNPALIEPLWRNGWRITEIIHRGEEVAFDALDPLRVWFHVSGMLHYSANCGGGALRMVALGAQRYWVSPGILDGVAYSCGETGNAQYSRVIAALRATRAYAIQDDQLILTGNQVRVVLELDETFPPIPGAHPVLLLHRWQWVSVTHRGERVAFDALQPLSSLFSIGGTIDVDPDLIFCAYALYQIVAEGEFLFHLVESSTTFEDCGEPGNTQFAQVTAALEATTSFHVQDRQLILTGEEVRIVLEPWSRPQ
jgi:hypothetical protein